MRGTQGGAVLEEVEVLPSALDGVVHRAGLTGFRIDETAAGFEVDDEFERLRLRIEIGGNDFPRRGESERLGKEKFDSHAPDARGKVAHKAPPLRRVSHVPFSQLHLVDNFPARP